MAAVTLIDVASSSVGGSPSAAASRSHQFSIVSLPDPANDDGGTSCERDYMLVTPARPPSSGDVTSPCHIHEIQAVLPHNGKYASYFVGSRIVSDPALHVSTRVDPLFFALAHFHRASAKDAEKKLEKWQPWDQALADVPSTILRALNLDPRLQIDGIGSVGQLRHLLDSSDMCGDDLVLVKFSEERTLRWLVAKFDRSIEAMRRRLREKKRKDARRAKELSDARGAANSSFTLAEDEENTTSENQQKKESSGGESIASSLSKEDEQSARVGALQLVCDYIPTEWKNKLAEKVGMKGSDWNETKKNAKSPSTSNSESCGEKRPRATWEGAIGQEDADALLQYTTGNGGTSSSSVITPSDKKKEQVRNAQSVGLKKLAKVNTKGMKSLTSFFGAGKKKKTK